MDAIGLITNSRTSHLRSAHLASINFWQSVATAPTRTGFRRWVSRQGDKQSGWHDVRRAGTP